MNRTPLRVLSDRLNLNSSYQDDEMGSSFFEKAPCWKTQNDLPWRLIKGLTFAFTFTFVVLCSCWLYNNLDTQDEPMWTKGIIGLGVITLWILTFITFFHMITLFFYIVKKLRNKKFAVVRRPRSSGLYEEI